METYDTYLPSELDKILSGLKLRGRTITKIESPSRIESSLKTERLKGDKYSLTRKNAEVDSLTILTLDDGRRIWFTFSSGSHVCVGTNTDIDSDECDATITNLFGSIVMGKKIKNYKIHKTKDALKLSRSIPYIDKGLDKNQKVFIRKLDLIFEDNDGISFENEYDYTLFTYDRFIYP